MAVGLRRTMNALASSSPKAVTPSFLLDCARPAKKKLSYARVRSISLPVRLHPLVSSLHDAARALMSWADAPAQTGPAWVADGAGRAGRVLAGLAGLLHYPQARDALRRPWTEQLLDDLLLLADLHGCFRESLVALRQLLAETHAALRRRDGVRLAAALRAQRRAAREVSRLASSARDLSHRAAPDDDLDEVTLADAFALATASVAAASAAVFSGVSSASAESAASAAPSPRTPTPYSPAGPSRAPASPMWLVADLLRRRRTASFSFEDYCNEEEEERKAAMGRVRGLEECVAAAETSGDVVFRALVNARVSLLNLLTPTF
ncbi:uncharacterized protein LOC100827696 [Brachypodium distachyon]|uniref:Uncharacterized protein n=1 Tax=Brachypodium distachyon TaxID=15368 RepID=I1I5S6_BRADI|nr:uncharacterized protein LOC100827696 [Brachypodium distachyon]PNT67812.1 hypothetical protein BRADI_3g32310v3 [Brachypodium distachyon]|eukprot:XP_003574270.1 uncharacterized protein LOC100827696 [Brachypodium distachyon]